LLVEIDKNKSIGGRAFHSRWVLLKKKCLFTLVLFLTWFNLPLEENLVDLSFLGQCQLLNIWECWHAAFYRFLNKWECGHASLHGSELASLSKAGMLTSLTGVRSTHLREHTSMLSLGDNVGWAALKQSITRALSAYATSPHSW